MNSLKKNLAKQESFKKKKRMHIPGVKPWVVRCAAVVLVLAVLLSIAWYVVPMYNAKFYLTRSALQTKKQLTDLWDQDEGEGEAYEDALKLVADEVKWNGHSILLLPGGLGISFTEQRNKDSTFSQGSLNVYFLGAIREGITYWANQDKVVFHIPGITQVSAETSQDTLKSTMGFTLTPEKKDQVYDDIRTIENDTIKMMTQSEIKFSRRDSSGVIIETQIPATVFDAYMNEIGDLILKGPLKDMKEWGQMLKERKTQGQSQKISFAIDKNMNISEIQIEGLGDLKLGFENNGGLLLTGDVNLNGREFSVDSKLYFGNGVEGKRSFQIPKLNVTYNNEKFTLGLELSGGYQGGRIPAETMEQEKLSLGEGQPEHDGLSEAKDLFLKKIKLLGFDFKE